MTLLHYIDNEVPWSGDYGEWDSRTQAGGSTITRTAGAAWPERGDYGLDIEKNTIHGSDSVDTAEIEIGLFFTEDEIF